jgi:acyl dehydratase
MDTLERTIYDTIPRSLSPVGCGLAACDLARPGIIENRTFDELSIGDAAQIVRTFTNEDIELFANVSGDVNPTHLDQDYAEETGFHGVVAHGMLGGSMFSTVLGTLLPGPGTIYLGQDLRFRGPVKPGDTLTAKVVVRETHADKKRVVLDCLCTNQHGKEVISGNAEVIAPMGKVRRERVALPEVSVIHHQAYTDLLSRAGGLPPLPTADRPSVRPRQPTRRAGRRGGRVCPAVPGGTGGKNPRGRGGGRPRPVRPADHSRQPFA